MVASYLQVQALLREQHKASYDDRSTVKILNNSYMTKNRKLDTNTDIFDAVDVQHILSENIKAYKSWKLR